MKKAAEMPLFLRPSPVTDGNIIFHFARMGMATRLNS
ncbi:hypothetical protein SAMN03097719_0408 [Pantoea ananatis]|nr:hypothetical protein SAMN03097719_0408 [Pantoea ananatis]